MAPCGTMVTFSVMIQRLWRNSKGCNCFKLSKQNDWHHLAAGDDLPLPESTVRRCGACLCSSSRYQATVAIADPRSRGSLIEPPISQAQIRSFNEHCQIGVPDLSWCCQHPCSACATRFAVFSTTDDTDTHGWNNNPCPSAQSVSFATKNEPKSQGGSTMLREEKTKGTADKSASARRFFGTSKDVRYDSGKAYIVEPTLLAGCRAAISCAPTRCK